VFGIEMFPDSGRTRPSLSGRTTGKGAVVTSVRRILEPGRLDRRRRNSVTTFLVASQVLRVLVPPGAVRTLVLVGFRVEFVFVWMKVRLEVHGLLVG
jgi:hypothetical protein